MPAWLPSIPYPAPGDGYWSPVTSTLNWCEEVSHPKNKLSRKLPNTFQDYYATVYFAEIVNTFTNLLFLWLGVKGVLNCRKEGHEKIFLISFLGYLVVGCGSFLFHATLKCNYHLFSC